MLEARVRRELQNILDLKMAVTDLLATEEASGIFYDVFL